MLISSYITSHTHTPQTHSHTFTLTHIYSRPIFKPIHLDIHTHAHTFTLTLTLTYTTHRRDRGTLEHGKRWNFAIFFLQNIGFATACRIIMAYMSGLIRCSYRVMWPENFFIIENRFCVCLDFNKSNDFYVNCTYESEFVSLKWFQYIPYYNV